MSIIKANARLLAVSVDGCAWDDASLAERLSRALRNGPPDPHRQALRRLSRFPTGRTPASRTQLAAFFQHDEPLREAWQTAPDAARVSIQLDANQMQEVSADWLAMPLPRLPDSRACRWRA